MRRITLLILCVVIGSASSFALTKLYSASHKVPLNGDFTNTPPDLVTSIFTNTNPGKLERIILNEEHSYSVIQLCGKYDMKGQPGNSITFFEP